MDITIQLTEQKMPLAFEAGVKILAFGPNHEAVVATAKDLLTALTRLDFPEGLNAEKMRAAATAFDSASSQGAPPAAPQHKRAALTFSLEAIARSNRTTTQALTRAILAKHTDSSTPEFAKRWADAGEMTAQSTLQVIKAVIAELLPGAHQARTGGCET